MCLFVLNKDKATAVYRNYKFFYEELNKRSDLKPFEFIELGLSKFKEILKTCSMKISQEQIINNEQWNKDSKEVEFEGKIWKLSPLTREIKKRRGECNDSGTYQGSKFWEYNGISVWDMCLK